MPQIKHITPAAKASFMRAHTWRGKEGPRGGTHRSLPFQLSLWPSPSPPTASSLFRVATAACCPLFRRAQEQIAQMKQYIARFGRGNSKLAAQAQSKAKTLAKMEAAGLTEDVQEERQFVFRFPKVRALSVFSARCNVEPAVLRSMRHS